MLDASGLTHDDVMIHRRIELHHAPACVCQPIPDTVALNVTADDREFRRITHIAANDSAGLARARINTAAATVPAACPDPPTRIQPGSVQPSSRPVPDRLDGLSDFVAGAVQHCPPSAVAHCSISFLALSNGARSCSGTKVLAEYVL